MHPVIFMFATSAIIVFKSSQKKECSFFKSGTGHLDQPMGNFLIQEESQLIIMDMCTFQTQAIIASRNLIVMEHSC